jgi:hypothetical protein
VWTEAEISATIENIFACAGIIPFNENVVEGHEL